jgi:hypothetical protein
MQSNDNLYSRHSTGKILHGKGRNEEARIFLGVNSHVLPRGKVNQLLIT